MSLLDRERIQLVTLQRKIKPALDRFEEEFARVASGDTPLIQEICQHIQNGKSKRFRPTLLLLSAQNGNWIDPRAITAAACLELVHTATLVHDDFIDGSLTRRGLPSISEAWGGPAAVIVGDYLYSQALNVLCENDQKFDIGLLVNTTLLMSQAEIMQLELKNNLDTTEQQYLRVISQKTASLIETACRIGAHYNPAISALEDSFGEFGRKIGLVFQITDDIFDFLGDERRLGKPTGRDWEEGRITLPLIAALKLAPPAEKARLIEVGTGDNNVQSSESWDLVKDFVTEHGGVEFAYQMARRCGEEAKQALAPIASGPQKDMLAVAVEYVINRLN